MLKFFAVAGLSFAVLSASWASTADAQVLTGKAAFGDWSKDAPGVTRHITADDLDPPNATPAASNTPQPVPMPEGAVPKVPDGFKVEMVASGIPNPRAIRFAPNGDLFVADSQSNQVLVYNFSNDIVGRALSQTTKTDKGGLTLYPPTAGQRGVYSVFAKAGLNQPYGIAFYPPGPDPQWVYVGNTNGVVRFPYKSGDLTATGKAETIVPNVPSGYHWTRDIVFTPDGKTMYLSVGSNSNVAEDMKGAPAGGVAQWAKDQPLGATWGAEQGRANIVAFDPDGKNRRIFATGLRNCAGMTLQPETNDLWCVVNERDELGDNVPFEYATHIAEGGYYGWPWYYIGNHEDPRLKGVRPDLAGKATVPDVLFQAHSAPLNIAFYTGDGFGPDYKGDAFVTMHGSWNRGTRTGYKVVVLPFKDGKPTGEYRDFMTGFVLSDQNVWGRPVGVAVAKDGSLFVSEDGSGTIWRVSRQ